MIKILIVTMKGNILISATRPGDASRGDNTLANGDHEVDFSETRNNGDSVKSFCTVLEVV